MDLPNSQSSDRRVLTFAVLMAFVLVINREGARVPSGNELVYLLYLAKAWHPNLLASDWTFQEPTAGHAVFNYTFGWLTRLFTLETVGWIGRVACWAVTFVALLRIGRRFRLPTWLAGGAILLWLMERQSPLAEEWVFGTFEAKAIAYACLFWAIELILAGRVVLPAILTGLTFSFHSAVGLWAGAAVGLAFATQRPIRQTLIFAAWAVAFALPGVVTSATFLAGRHAITSDEARYVVTVEMPFHLDPFVFSKTGMMMLAAALTFSVLHARAHRDEPAVQFLVRFELFAAAFFVAGVAARWVGAFRFVELFPFRVFAVTCVLIFAWQLAATWHHRKSQPPGRGLITAAVVTVLLMSGPLREGTAIARHAAAAWLAKPDDFDRAAIWVRDNSPLETVVVAPPWPKEAFYIMRRPLIADWHVPRFDAMTQWHERIESLVGGLSRMSANENLAADMDERARDHYANLPKAKIEDIRARYGGDLLISPGQYDWPVLFSAGAYRVYQLRPPGNAATTMDAARSSEGSSTH